MKKITRFVIASNNRAKTAELIKCFSWLDQTAISYQSLLGRLDFPVEGAKSYVDNATVKAQFIAEKLPDEWVVGDDSGMILSAYPDWLGVLTARQLKINDLTDDELNQKIIELVAGRSRSVQMRSFLVAINGHEKVMAEGDFKGKISHEPRGMNGRGFDLILQPNGYSQTLAQLNDDEKIPLLHRTQAVENLLQQLRGNDDAD